MIRAPQRRKNVVCTWGVDGVYGCGSQGSREKFADKDVAKSAADAYATRSDRPHQGPVPSMTGAYPDGTRVGAGVPGAAKETSRIMVKSRVKNDFCVDVAGISKNAGAEILMWDCWNGPNQRWTYDAKQRLVSENSGMCMDVWNGNATAGADIKQSACHDGPNQRWTNDDGMLKPAHTKGMCLDISGGGTANGSKLMLYPCHGQKNQRFDFKPAPKT